MPPSEEHERDEVIAVMVEKNHHKNKRKRHDRTQDRVFPRIAYAWYHATVGPVFFFFLVAYMLQTSLVKTYVEEELCIKNHTYSFSFNDSEIHEKLSVPNHRDKRANLEQKMCPCPENGGSSNEHTKTDRCPCQEGYEEELSYWNLVLLIIYAGPTLILAPVLGSWTDGLHRVYPMYICALGMAISSVCVAVAMLLASSTQVVVYCTMPSGLTGGAVLFTIAMYSYEAEKKQNFEIFESYLKLQCIYVAAKTLVQLLIHFSSTDVAKAALIWGPLMFSSIACFGLIHRRIRDDRPVRFKFCHFTFVHLSKDFLHMLHARLLALHFLLFLCAFVFYFAYVGETSEIMNIINHNEPWEIASFSIYGAAQGVTESVGLLLTLYFWKNIIHKKIIDKELLPHFSVFLLGILGYTSDMVTKLIVAVTPESSVQYWGKKRLYVGAIFLRALLLVILL